MADFKRNLHTENTTDQEIISLLQNTNEELSTENSNKNPSIVSVQRDYVAGIASKDIARRMLIDPEVIEYHDRGAIHMHDLDYFIQPMYNCCLINLEDMLQNGTVISGVSISKPKSFQVACTIATQIIAQVASSQYGGQSISVGDLAPFVDVSRKKIAEKVRIELAGLTSDEEIINEIIENRLKDEIRDGVQTIQYQITTLMTTNGQAPFITIFMYLNECLDSQTKHDASLIIEEMLKQRIKGVQNEKGAWVTPAFPKLIYVLQDDNVTPDGEYYWLTKLAAECTSKRMVPDYISEKIMKSLKTDDNGDGHCYSPMGCRSVLTTYLDENNKPKYKGRFNQGVVTLNLPYIALQSKDSDDFWIQLDKHLSVALKGMLAHHNKLRGVKSDVAPILWQHGAIARLKPGETIDKFLFGGYSTLSLGYAGLWETVTKLIGKPLTDPEAETLGLKILQKLNDQASEWKAQYNIAFSVYGTPLESTTYKFAQANQRDFEIIKGVNDKSYVTNSYHIHVTHEIDAFSKIAFESKFQELSPGGAISYIEAPNMSANHEALLSIIKFMYDNILYSEINMKSDYCLECDYDGEIFANDVDGRYLWECPQCHCVDQDRLSIARRVCGYIGTNKFNYGRTSEIHDRVLHI